MSQPAQPAGADAPARPDKPDDDNDFYGTDDYFGRDRFFTDQPPSEKETSE
jgi:hypothetical protein